VYAGTIFSITYGRAQIRRARAPWYFEGVAFPGIVAISWLFVTVGFAADWTEAARRLVREAGGAAMREPAGFTFENRAQLPAAEVAAARRALDAELRRAGMRLNAPNPAVEIRSVLAENVREYVWTIEVRKGEERFAAAVAVARDAPAGPEKRPLMRLEATLLWSQPEPILDAGFPAADRLLVLDRWELTLLRRDAAWSPLATLSLALPGAQPRDPRGRLVTGQGTWTAWLPGATCTGVVEPLAGACRAATEPWPTAAGPARLAEGRNYFEGAIPYYSVAAWKDGIAFAALDRRVHVQGEAFAGWGSDIAGVTSECGAGQQVLATRPGDGDAITAYEFIDRQPTAVSAPFVTPGQVTALWSDGGRAIAVIKATRYETYAISVRCAP
jgi:hypothetical protein